MNKNTIFCLEGPPEKEYLKVDLAGFNCACIAQDRTNLTMSEHGIETSNFVLSDILKLSYREGLAGMQVVH